MNEITKRIKQSLEYIEREVEKIDEAPEKALIVELLEALEDVDEQYKYYCEELDEDYNEEKGTHYEHGVNMEFYVEGESWHDVSIALRKLKELTNG